MLSSHGCSCDNSFWQMLLPCCAGCWSLTAVEHNTEQSHGLGQVLGGFRLAGAGWASRSASQPICQSCGQGHITPVAMITSQGCMQQGAVLHMVTHAGEDDVVALYMRNKLFRSFGQPARLTNEDCWQNRSVTMLSECVCVLYLSDIKQDGPTCQSVL